MRARWCVPVSLTKFLRRSMNEGNKDFWNRMKLFSRVLRYCLPRLVGRSVVASCFCFCGLLPHCSCPSILVTSNIATAHPHATGIAVYPALFCQEIDWKWRASNQKRQAWFIATDPKERNLVNESWNWQFDRMMIMQCNYITWFCKWVDSRNLRERNQIKKRPSPESVE